MVSSMETIGPSPDSREASAGLDAIADAQHAVRDRPWPLWLYPTNALLLGALALTGVLESSMLAALLTIALAAALALLNYVAGRQMGTPFAIPTSRGFRILTALAAALVLLSVFARLADLDSVVVACAAGATISYAAGSVLHHRSTRR